MKQENKDVVYGYMDRKAEIRVTGLRWSILEAQNFYYMEWSREVGLLCIDKREVMIFHTDQHGGSVSKYN